MIPHISSASVNVHEDFPNQLQYKHRQCKPIREFERIKFEYYKRAFTKGHKATSELLSNVFFMEIDG